MRFGRRLLLLFTLAVLLSVMAVTGVVSTLASRALDRANDERTAALVAEFEREFGRRGEDVARRTQSAAQAPEVTRMAVAAARSQPDYSPFLETAEAIAQAARLDFLEFADDRGTIISSAHWPAKFGYREALAKPTVPAGPFLKQEELPSGSALGLFAMRSLTIEDRRLYVLGGIRLDKSFLASLEPPSGMRVLLYENLDGGAFSPAHLVSRNGPVEDAQPLAGLIEGVLREGGESRAVIHWSSHEETVTASPLAGESRETLAVLLIGSSRQIYLELRRQIRSAALLALAVGMALAILVSSWTAARITKPVEELARAARQISDGDWTTSVIARSRDEIGELAEGFNRMTRHLREQQERLVQAERVAAWRELARRLAHELKNPLFPLQLTVENLLRARELGEQEFDETFRESAATLLSGIHNLKAVVEQFSDFSKMPQPEFARVDLEQLVGTLEKLYQPQLTRANIHFRLEARALEPVPGDPELLERALSNLVLNAIEAMPAGGTLRVRITGEEGSVRIEVSDTGAGLSQEECARLFTPYYTTKPHGTGLGLAIVQSIVSDHHGRIRVASQPERGTTFIIDLPLEPSRLSKA